MASSEMHQADPGAAPDGAPPAAESTKTNGSRVGERPAAGEAALPRRAGRAIASAERDRLLREARNVEFPVGVRGYQRAAVDRYVERVNRLITELEMYSSPESAVRHALDEVSDETREILQRAHESAEEITVRSRARADERLQEAEEEARRLLAAAEERARELREAAQREALEARETAQREARETREAAQREIAEARRAAQREADSLLENARRHAEETLEAAEARTAELARSAELIWRERKRLIEDVRAVGDQLVTLGEAEGKRFSALPEELSLAAHQPPEQPATLG